MRKNGGGFLRDVEGAGEIYAHDAFEFFQRQLLDRAVADDPGVVDQDVEAAEFFADRFHHRLDLFRIGHVALDDQRILQFLGDGFGVRFVLAGGIGDVVHDALRAAFAERLDHLRAETARAAGHEHDFAGEIERIGH